MISDLQFSNLYIPGHDAASYRPHAGDYEEDQIRTEDWS